VAFFRSLALTVLAVALGSAEDPVAALSHRIEQGSAHISFDDRYGYLPSLLRELHVPVESQIAVFSKTSIQSLRIEPSNPRVLYFNDSVSVGWVQGGFIELAAPDPGHGINYYILQQLPNDRLTLRQDCVKCHESGKEQFRSVTVGADGVPAGSERDADYRTPFRELWGGWFVTGATVPDAHQGNAAFLKGERRAITPSLDPKVGLTSTSDVVALLTFSHQVRMTNLFARPDNINELVDSLLFVDEAPLPGPVRGNSGFAEKFSSTGPRDHLGRSLREFDLNRRLMRYPCSYMIYTDAFDALPGAAKEAVYRRMSAILTGKLDDETGSRYRQLSTADRNAIIGILRDTKPGLPAWFAAP
jgi:hypothetical protein